MIVINQRGDFKHTEGFFKRAKEKRFYSILNEYGARGVKALEKATPKRTGKTAASWSYTVKVTDSGAAIYFENSNVVDGWANVAVLLQYGHAARNGAWVEGVDYINPAIQPIFDEIAEKVWAEVNKS